MNGGDLTVNITADYAAFQKAMDQVQRQATSSGKMASKGFADEFKFQLSKNFSDQKVGSMIGQVLSFGAADRLMRGLADGIREDKSFGTMLNDFIKGLPVVGAAYDLGLTMGDSLSDGFFNFFDTGNKFTTAAEAAAAKAALAQEEIAQAAAQKAAEARAEARQRELELEDTLIRDANGRSLELKEELLREQAKMEIEAAKMSGNERLAAELETAEELRRLDRQRIEAYGETAPSEFAFQSAKAVFDERDKLAREGLRRRLEEIDKQETEEIAAAERVKQERDRMIYEMEEERRQAMVKAAEEAQLEIDAMNQERMMAGAAGVTGLQTALGQFKFDAYPDAEKKRNDERLVKGIEKIASSTATGGFI